MKMSKTGQTAAYDDQIGSSGSDKESKNNCYMLRRCVEKVHQFATPSKRPPTASSSRRFDQPTQSKVSKTKFVPPKPGTEMLSGSVPKKTDPVEVYCRLRPLDPPDSENCIIVKDGKSLVIYTPDSSNNKTTKESTYTFDNVFNAFTGQKFIFDEIAKPLVGDLLDGKSGLLFAYGVTGSGKTYTMSGTSMEPGIMPRVVDVLFNSITSAKAPKYSFKPDHLNGFEPQSQAEIMAERQKDLLNIRTPRALRSGFGSRVLPVIESDSEGEERTHDTTTIPLKNVDSLYSVFVTYIQIYNNQVYDLLDGDVSSVMDLQKKEAPQTKVLREDSSHNMYVHGATEVEIDSAEDALQIFKRGQKRRRIASTALNTESSRSHAIFNIRLVQAPLDEQGEELIQDRSFISISQLSLVDLAGSERLGRTGAAGQRLKEGSNINASLMCLRKCVDALRKKQKQGNGAENNNLVPYRDTKLTHFLKSYFEGEAEIRMILCLNPRAEDYDENLHVLAFAEMTQEVQVARAPPLRQDLMTPGRRKANTILKEAQRNMFEDGFITEEDLPPMDIGVLFNLGPPLPLARMTKAEEGELLMKLRKALEFRIKGRNNLHSFIMEKRTEFRNRLVEMERELGSLKSSNVEVTSKFSSVIDEKEEMANVIRILQFEKTEVELKVDDLTKDNERLTQQIQQLRGEYRQLELVHTEERNRLESDMEIQRELDGMKRDRQMKQEEAKLKAVYKEKDKTIAAMKSLVSQVDIGVTNSTRLSRTRTRQNKMSVESLSTTSESDIPSTICTSPDRNIRKMVSSEPRLRINSPNVEVDTPGVVITKHRRSISQSTDKGKWLEHTPARVVDSSTVFQPLLKKKKSVQKLINVEDLSQKTSKYCLRMDIQDEKGDIETQLYKADVLQTVGGGAQVIFNDVEILKQVSPGKVSPTNRKRISTSQPGVAESVDLQELTAKCTTGIGHQVIKRARNDQ